MDDRRMREIQDGVDDEPGPGSEGRSLYGQAIDHLDVALERLSKTINELEGRLAPALCKEKPEEKAKDGTAVTFYGSSDLVRHLGATAQYVDTITYRVGRIRDDIEL